jgi:hypothetical protein
VLSQLSAFVQAGSHLNASSCAGVPSLRSLLKEQSWVELVDGEASKSYWKALETFVHQQWRETVVYPKREHIFRALNSVPLDKVQVVILGQVWDSSGPT